MYLSFYKSREFTLLSINGIVISTGKFYIWVTIVITLAERVHSRLRVDMDHHNALIQSFHISTCKKHAYCVFIDAKY